MSLALTLALLFAPVPQEQPDPEHAALARLAGEWTVRQSFWTAPGTAPKVDAGSASFTVVLGRQLRQTLRIPDPAKPFEGLGYIGYDNATGRYFSTWMDVNFPGLIVAEGGRDASGVYEFRGSMAVGKGKPAIAVREVLRVADADHFTYEYFEPRDGKEMLTVRLEYSRK
jgi:hypothetical protein